MIGWNNGTIGARTQWLPLTYWTIFPILPLFGLAIIKRTHSAFSPSELQTSTYHLWCSLVPARTFPFCLQNLHLHIWLISSSSPIKSLNLVSLFYSCSWVTYKEDVILLQQWFQVSHTFVRYWLTELVRLKSRSAVITTLAYTLYFEWSTDFK